MGTQACTIFNSYLFCQILVTDPWLGFGKLILANSRAYHPGTDTADICQTIYFIINVVQVSVVGPHGQGSDILAR